MTNASLGRTGRKKKEEKGRKRKKEEGRRKRKKEEEEEEFVMSTKRLKGDKSASALRARSRLSDENHQKLWQKEAPNKNLCCFKSRNVDLY